MGHPLFVRPHTSDIAVVQELLWEKAYLPAVQRCPRPVKAILDLGGNVGYSVRFWQEQFPDAEIVVVEPDPGNYRQLRKNIEIGGRRSGFKPFTPWSQPSPARRSWTGQRTARVCFV